MVVMAIPELGHFGCLQYGFNLCQMAQKSMVHEVGISRG